MRGVACCFLVCLQVIDASVFWLNAYHLEFVNVAVGSDNIESKNVIAFCQWCADGRRYILVDVPSVVAGLRHGYAA